MSAKVTIANLLKQLPDTVVECGEYQLIWDGAYKIGRFVELGRFEVDFESPKESVVVKELLRLMEDA